MSDGFVYFIQEEESGNIKIGFSEKHPKGRLKDFQTGNSNKLILLGYIEGTYEDESNLHREFHEERLRNENEWFKKLDRLINDDSFRESSGREARKYVDEKYHSDRLIQKWDEMFIKHFS